MGREQRLLKANKELENLRELSRDIWEKQHKIQNNYKHQLELNRARAIDERISLLERERKLLDTPIRLKQYGKNKACYYCGAVSSTREHAPPKLMFKEFDCSGITVPSCEVHNNGKDYIDFAIISVLLRTLEEMPEAKASLPERVIRSIETVKPNFGRAKRRVSSRKLLEFINIEVPYIDADIYNWIRQLSAALVWSVTGEFDPFIRWNEAFIWNAQSIENSEPLALGELANHLFRASVIERGLEQLEWRPGWSSTPVCYPHDVYCFDVCLSPPDFPEMQGEQIAFKHRFYSRLNWYILFSTSKMTKITLENIANQIEAL